MAEPLVFDEDAALKRVDGDLDLYGELRDIFFEEYPDMLEQLKSAVKSSEGKKVQECAHSMKSALGNLGAMKAYALAQVIEQNGAQNRLEIIETNIKNLENEIEKYRETIEHFLKQKS